MWWTLPKCIQIQFCFPFDSGTTLPFHRDSNPIFQKKKPRLQSSTPISFYNLPLTKPNRVRRRSLTFQRVIYRDTGVPATELQWIVGSQHNLSLFRKCAYQFVDKHTVGTLIAYQSDKSVRKQRTLQNASKKVRNKVISFAFLFLALSFNFFYLFLYKSVVAE